MTVRYELLRRDVRSGRVVRSKDPLPSQVRVSMQKLPLAGLGYLAGEFPGGTTTVEGAPTTAEVRAIWRGPAGHPADGAVCGYAQSGVSGTWLIQNLNESLKYDVVGRKEGFNDVIVSNVMPTSMVDITYTGDITSNETFTGALGYIELVGGMPPYTASVVDPLPAGLFPVVDGHQLIIDGTTTDDDVFNSTVRVTSSNGATKDVPVKLVVGFKAPANFEAETLEDAGTFSVVLTWEVTNSTQEVLVFKSTTPFDLESMPAPIATLTGDAVSYTDDDVIEDDVFYYMVTSVCEGFTLYSDEVREVVVVDPHWDKVVSLLHFDGNLTDEAGGAWAGRSISYAPSPDEKFGSEFVGGNGSVQRTATRQLGTLWGNVTAFTLEARVTLTSFPTVEYPTPAFLSKRGTGISTDDFGMFVSGESDNQLVASLATTVGRTIIISNSVLELGVPTHVAACYDGEEFRLYIDGVLEAQSPVSGVARNRSNPLTIGALSENTSYQGTWLGRIDEIRITRDVARYTENFTPPSKPFPNK